MTVFLENPSDLKFLAVFYILLIHKFHYKDLNNEILKELKVIHPSLTYLAMKNQIQYLKHLLLSDFARVPPKTDLSAPPLSKNHQQRRQLEYYLKHLKKLIQPVE